MRKLAINAEQNRLGRLDHQGRCPFRNPTSMNPHPQHDHPPINILLQPLRRNPAGFSDGHNPDIFPTEVPIIPPHSDGMTTGFKKNQQVLSRDEKDSPTSIVWPRLEQIQIMNQAKSMINATTRISNHHDVDVCGVVLPDPVDCFIGVIEILVTVFDHLNEVEGMPLEMKGHSRDVGSVYFGFFLDLLYSISVYDDAPATRSICIDSALDAYQTSASTYISQRPSKQLVGILCVAVILHKGRVLLIRRAADDNYPNVWEVPGGVARDNETIIDCAFQYGNSLLLPSGSSQRGKWIIFIFRVMVDDQNSELEIKLDPKEHRAHLWATREEVQDDSCGDLKLDWISVNQKRAILEAFDEAER
ncbi:NUDIX hydrolase [Aspergillus affinis]|uniref:NUDIX hydrolase n=1 Tax=Aspergillus affinis TaxID=1070780 RepID=UPI0022FDB2DE|nr:uncharacterized protein KD926_010771 [Aspergillus affinis]KAI9038459.1 hypothetical protein KD926_010771 [Aspergillus affinis]